MTAHYLDLTGAALPDIDIDDLLSPVETVFHTPAPRIAIPGAIVDISDIGPTTAKGIADQPPQAGTDDAVAITFVQNRQELFGLKARVLNTPETPLQITLRFEESLDLKALSKANGLAHTRTFSDALARRRAAPVPDDWVTLCSDILDHAASARRFIASTVDPIAADLSPVESRELGNNLIASAREDWSDFFQRGTDQFLAHHENPRVHKAMKRFAEDLVTPEMVGGANWHRSYFKPLGYPGDYQIMNYFYDNDLVGETWYNKYLHLLGSMGARCINNRMLYLADMINSLEETFPDQGQFRLMSIGAGPAREIRTFGARRPDRGATYEFTLLDQDRSALAYAFSDIYSHLAGTVQGFDVRAKNTSFTQMLRPTTIFDDLAPQDVVYSAGLLDYLKPDLARRLVRKFYDMTRPGGMVVIGNAAITPTSRYWILDYILDWELIARTEQEMVDLAALCDGADVTVTPDETNTVFMLKIRKPDGHLQKP